MLTLTRKTSVIAWFDQQALRLQAWSGFNRRGLLMFACATGFCNSLLFYFLPQKQALLDFNLYGGLVFAMLFVLVWKWYAEAVVSHVLVAFSMVLLSGIALNTGGINSPNIAWMSVIPVAALMLLGERWAWSWLIVVLWANVFQWVAIHTRWVNAVVDPGTFPLDRAIVTRLNVMFFLMLAIGLYDWMRNVKLRDVAARNTDLLATHQALRQAQAHRDEFIASVGHELRTPMNAILGLNSMLVADLAANQQHVHIAVHIRQATEHLLRVVNDILDISQLEAGRLILHPGPFSLADCIRRCIAHVQVRADDKNLQLIHGIDPALPVWIDSDQHRLTQILHHLLDNAVKFTPSGFVQLRCFARDTMLRIEVQDSGAGIDPTINQAIFNRFALASSGIQRMYGGSGLGLSLCDRLVALLGGCLGLISPPEGGSLFWFEIPLKAADSPNTVSHSLPAMGSHPPRFLVVDDKPVNLMVADLLLHKLWPGCRVQLALSGVEALTLFNPALFDVVLMDVLMPGLDGLQTTQRLRAQWPLHQHTLLVIGLTAQSLSSERETCLAAGMNAVIPKPIDPNVLLATLQPFLGGANAN